MVEDDSGDIYELDKGFILWYNGNVTEDITNAIQGQREGTSLSKGLPEEQESEAPPAIQAISEKMAGGESRQGEAVQPEVLLGEQGKRNSSLHQGQCQATQDIEVSCADSLRGEPAEVPMLRGIQDSVSINRPHQWMWSGTSERNQTHRFDIRMAKEGEIPSRLQGFVHELQHGSRLLWFLPPSRGRNLRLRKSDIPLDLLQYFHLAQEERWRLRNDIVWNKPNPMPESVKDRFTGSWEHLFFFSKSKHYFFEQQFNEYTGPLNRWGGDTLKHETPKTAKYKDMLHLSPSSALRAGNQIRPNALGRNQRDVWEICTEASNYDFCLKCDTYFTGRHRSSIQAVTVDDKDKKKCPVCGSTEDWLGHFATYPEKLCETPILAGCPSMICKNCGKARVKVYGDSDWESHQSEGMAALDTPDSPMYRGGHHNDGLPYRANIKDLGYTDCGCSQDFEPGVVLDPFCGSGTTLVAAKRLGRKSIGIDISPNYCRLTVKRLQEIPLSMELG
jgi:hypothetical protein